MGTLMYSATRRSHDGWIETNKRNLLAVLMMTRGAGEKARRARVGDGEGWAGRRVKDQEFVAGTQRSEAGRSSRGPEGAVVEIFTCPTSGQKGCVGSPASSSLRYPLVPF